MQLNEFGKGGSADLLTCRAATTCYDTVRHTQVTELKNTAKIAALAKDADVLISRNGETIAYLVNPEHYEAMISAWNELR